MFKALVGVGAVVLVAGSVLVWQRQATPRFEREIPWAANGVWLKAETHVHSRFSDSRHTIDESVDRAVQHGCDVLAITDHTDAGLKAATPEYHAAIAAARARQPALVLLTGFEWNVPPARGDDHAVLLVPPGLDSSEVWTDFKTRYDDYDRKTSDPELLAGAFQWLNAAAIGQAGGAPVMFLDHPSRKAKSIDEVTTRIEELSRMGAGIFVGVEGAPGHQKATPLGAYPGPLTPDDRWDPAIAPPGASWDTLLARGHSLWGALATSDFHGESNGDYWPCQFSSTWVYAREKSATGVLDAFRAGSFAGEHGGIARRMQLTLTADGLKRPAIAGEAVHLPGGATAIVEVTAEVPEADWEGQPNRIDTVDFIGVTKSGATVLASTPLVAGTARHELTIPAGGISVRARGRRVVEAGPDLLFYTNPITVK